MKNWGFKYRWSIILLLLIASCSDSKNSSFLESDNNVISIATDENLKSFNFYSNNVFSKFIKDLVCEPIFYYNTTTKKATSTIISSYKWVHESEIELTVLPTVYFQNNQRHQLYKERKLTPKDIAHSILLQKENASYREVRKFLETFEKITQKGKDVLVISLKKSVDPQAFLLEFASIEIPVVPIEVEKISSLKDVVGNGLYSLDFIAENQIRLKLFKRHTKIKALENKSIILPKGYLINLDVPHNKQFQLLKDKSVDGIITSSISVFMNKINQLKNTFGNMIIRQEDELHIAAFNFEKSFTSNYSNIEYIKKLIDPTAYNQVYCNNQLNTFYSIYDLEDVSGNTISSLTVNFECDAKFKNYVLTKFNKKNINLQQTDTPDLSIYKLITPTNNSHMINQYIYRKYISLGFINNEKVAKEASIKLFQPIKYILFNRNIKFRNDSFETRNDFSTVYKYEDW